jgi:DHA1 family multidrug resistance protein-like MFS transporter
MPLFRRHEGGAASPDAQREPRPRLARDVYVLGVIAFFVMVGFGVVVPVLPVYVRSFGVGYTEIGAVVAAFALMRLLVTPAVGRLIDWVGERAILSTGILIVAVSSGLVGIATDYPQVLLLRGAGGIGSAMFSVAAMTLLLGSTSSTHRARALGFYQGGFLIGGMAGPAVGGLLATISLTAPFFFYAGTLVIAGLVGILLLQPARRADGSRAEKVTPVTLRFALRDIRYRAALAANFAQGWTSFGVRGALVPVIVVEVIKGPTAWTGIAFASAAVAQTLALAPAARFVDTIGRRPAMIGALFVAAVTIMGISFVTDIWVLGALLCVYGVASAFLGTAPAASVGDVVSKGGARAVSLFSMFGDFGAILGPLVAGALVDAFSFPVAFGVGAVLLAAASLYAARMPRRVAAELAL